MIYVTLDNDGSFIEKDAHIVAFETREEAEEYLRRPYNQPLALEEGERVDIVQGRFGDCWLKLHRREDAEGERLAEIAAPFALEDLIVRSPGQHPGGKWWWVEVRPTVLVAVTVAESE